MSLLHALLKKPFFGRFQKPWAWPPSVPESEWTRVTFRNASGATLVGLHGRAAGGAARATVVMPHPMTGDAKGYLLRSGHAALLREGGYDVLLFDFNGFGDSENGRFEFPDDIVAAGRFAQERAPELPVALFGISMGAGYGVCALDTPGHPFRAAVIESAFTSLEEFWIKFRVAYVLLRALSAILPRTAGTLRPIARIRSIAGVEAILFIYGDADSFTPPAMGERLLEACPLPTERRSLWVVPKAKHLRALDAARDEYRRRVVEFFDAQFAAPRAAAAK